MYSVGDQPRDVARGIQLIDERLRLRHVDGGVHQLLVDVVQAHAAELLVLEAPERVERRRIAGRLGGLDVLGPRPPRRMAEIRSDTDMS